MKYIVLTFFFIFSLGSSANNTHRSNCEELIDLLRVQENIMQAQIQLIKTVEYENQKLESAHKGKVLAENYTEKMKFIIESNLDWNLLKKDIVDLYAKSYTEKEVKDMIEFYQSETGKAVINKTPQLLKETKIITQTIVDSFLPKIIELREEMKNRLSE